MVDYLKNFLKFGRNQGLSEDEILELVGFVLSHVWQKQLLVQGFDTSTNILNYLIEFCKRLDTEEESFNERGDGSHPNKKPNQFDASHQKAFSSGKGSYQAAELLEEDARMVNS